MSMKRRVEQSMGPVCRVRSSNAPFGIILYEMWGVDRHRWVRQRRTLRLNAGVGFAQYTFELGKDLSLDGIGWDWIVEDMPRGIKRNQVLSIQENEFDGCNGHLLHLRIPDYGN